MAVGKRSNRGEGGEEKTKEHKRRRGVQGEGVDKEGEVM